MRKSLQAVLGQSHASIRCFATPEECLRALATQRCDLLIINMDDRPKSGLELLVQSKQMHPMMRALALVKRGDVPLAVRAMKAGAADCLEWNVRMEVLVSTVRRLLRQGGPAHPGIDTALTKTERLVLAHLLEGEASRIIAGALHRSPRTIEVHRKTIMRKLGASNLVDLVRLTARMGLMNARSTFPTSNLAQTVRT